MKLLQRFNKFGNDATEIVCEILKKKKEDREIEKMRGSTARCNRLNYLLIINYATTDYEKIHPLTRAAANLSIRRGTVVTFP